MKKVFPIKVEKLIQSDMKFIEWKIHNVCNHNCSFCRIEYKRGDERWYSLEKYKNYVDKIAAACNGSPFWIQITGGEPSLFPELIDLLKYIKQKGAFISLISNGTRTLRWWEELKNEKVLDFLILTFHSEQTTDYKHMVDVINVFHKEPVDVLSLITHVAGTFQKAEEAYNYIIENTGATVLLKAMVISSMDLYALYTPEELAKLKKSYVSGKKVSTKVRSKLPNYYKIDHKLKITLNNSETIIKDPQELLKEKQNQFLNWNCNIGSNSMRIDYDKLYRGVCQVGEARSMDDESLHFTTDFIKCTDNFCYCGTDMIAEKRRTVESYPDT